MVGSVYFLFVSLSCLLLYIAPFLWPLVVIAQGGTLLTLYHKSLGFYLGCIALIVYGIVDYERLCLQSFMFYFLASLGVSWLIEYLQQKDKEDYEAKVMELEGLLEREKLESNRWMKESATLDQRVQRLEAEKDTWALKQPEEKSQTPVVSVQAPQLIAEDLSLEADYKLLTHNHQQLKMQFEEKSHVLLQTRKEYFNLETECLALTKTRQEEALFSQDELYQILLQLTALFQEQEEQIKDLEAIVTHALSTDKPKRQTRSRKKMALAMDLLDDLR